MGRELKFKLGEEYGVWEFELCAVSPYQVIENNLTYEVYEYIGEPIYLLDCAVGRVLLYFNADILHKVCYELDIKFQNQIMGFVDNDWKVNVNESNINIIHEYN